MKETARLLRSQKAFTLVELILIMGILGILAAAVLVVLDPIKLFEDSKLRNATEQLDTLATAFKVYAVENGGQYPADVARGIPSGIEQYLKSGVLPEPAWDGAVYDWDNYINEGEQVYQISIRFCPLGQPENCNFPKADWAADFGYNSSVYLCMKGPCKSHASEAADYPGLCVNCEE